MHLKEDQQLEEFLKEITFSKDYIDFAIENYSIIPKVLMENIIGYVQKGERLGGFLHALFSNDLMRSIAQADDTNIKLIPLYCRFIYMECPSKCHGSYEIVEAWQQNKGQQQELNE